MLYYFLQVNVYLLFFYGIYRLLLGNSSSYGWRRYFLLCISLSAALLPVLRMSSPSLTPGTNTVTTRVLQLREFLVTNDPVPVTGSNDWFSIGFISIASLLLIRLGLQYGQMIRFISRHQAVRIQEISTILNSDAGPGSFFHTIVLPGNSADPALFRHEAAHIRYGHHYDRLYLNILRCLLFPVLPLILVRKELELVHEFQADAAACTDRTAYAELLLNEHFQTRHFSMMHHFFQHPLKQRIMMLQHANPIRNGKKVLLLLLAGLSIGGIITAQSCTQKEPVAKVVQPGTPEEVFKEVAQVPQFPGGDTALFRFLGDHVQYPKHEEELHVDGTVRAKFIVDKSGKIRNIEIVKHATPAMDEEVVRVINAMPAWTPGRNEQGEAVSVYFQIPITFKSYKQNDHVTFTTKMKKVG